MSALYALSAFSCASLYSCAFSFTALSDFSFTASSACNIFCTLSIASFTSFASFALCLCLASSACIPCGDKSYSLFASSASFASFSFAFFSFSFAFFSFSFAFFSFSSASLLIYKISFINFSSVIPKKYIRLPTFISRKFSKVLSLGLPSKNKSSLIFKLRILDGIFIRSILNNFRSINSSSFMTTLYFISCSIVSFISGLSSFSSLKKSLTLSLTLLLFISDFFLCESNFLLC